MGGGVQSPGGRVGPQLSPLQVKRSGPLFQELVGSPGVYLPQSVREHTGTAPVVSAGKSTKTWSGEYVFYLSFPHKERQFSPPECGSSGV